MSASSALDSLGIEFATDKSSLWHNYLAFYETYFAGRRYDNLHLLEIGVERGASLKVWESYFPNATIVGVDINPAVRQFARRRVAIEIADQSREADLTALGTKHGPFDIVIDDGSHIWSHQIISLRTLFPFLKQNGIYIIEDLQTNYGEHQPNFRGDADISCVEYLKKLVDVKVADGAIDTSNDPDPFIGTYASTINSITFYKQLCLIQNGYALGVDEPFVQAWQGALSDAEVGLSIKAHLGWFGDRASGKPVLQSGGMNHSIQGFAIGSHGVLGSNLEYKARLRGGAWTGWAPVDQFVGTKGQGDDLTGFAVRLTGACTAMYDLFVAGRFRGIDPPVIVRGGRDCTTEFGLRPLYGMQIIVLPARNGEA